MSRSGYSDDCDNWALIRWRGAVKAAINGKRGQRALREMLVALDALPEKVLVANELVSPTGHFCALGALGVHRGVSMGEIDPEDHHTLADALDISTALAREIAYENDEGCGRFGAERGSAASSARWQRMRTWVAGKIQPRELNN